MSKQVDQTTYHYGEDVERYLHDKGLTIEDLVKQHKRNLVENGNQIGASGSSQSAGAGDAQATVAGRPPEKWETASHNVDADWSKVLERDPLLQTGSAMTNKAQKRTGKSSKKLTAKKTAASASKRPFKMQPPTKTQILRDKKTTSAYSEVKSANAKKMSKAESAALAVITGKSSSSKKVEEKNFIPKKTQDDEVLDIITEVLGGRLGEYAVRQTVQSSPFFSSDPVIAARLKALGQVSNVAGTVTAPDHRGSTSWEHPELQTGVVAAQEGAQDARGTSSKALISKLDTMVRKINSKADQVELVAKKESDEPKADQIVQERAPRAAMTTEDIVTRATEAGVNSMTYTQMEAVLTEEDTPKPLLSSYLVEAFSHPTSLILPENKYSRLLFRPNAQPYGLDEDTGPAYRENPPSTISYGGPVPPLESRKVRPITDTSPQIQDPINHIIKTPWEDVLADKRTVAAPCKRTTILQKDFVPSEVDLGLDDVETIDPTTIALTTEPEKAKEEAEAKIEEDDSINVDDVSQMKANADVAEVDADPINQSNVDVKDEPPKGLVQELTAAIVAQLKAEGILAGGGGLGNGQNTSSSFTPEMLAMLMAQQQNMMQNNFAQNEQEMDGFADPALGNNVDLANRTRSRPFTSLGSALLTARVSGMSYDNQAPLRGIKTATMNPYRPIVSEQAKANVWQARSRPAIGAIKQPGGPAGQSAIPGIEQGPIVGAGSAVLEEKSKTNPGANRVSEASAAHTPLAAATNAGVENEIDLNRAVTDQVEDRHISDEEPTLTAEQQKDLFTKCLNNRAKQVEELFSLSVPVDTIDEHGNTCLHVACQCGSKRMVKACLRWNADINKQNKQGQTALHYCFAYKYEELAAYLVQKGADDTIVNNFGLTCYEGLKPEDDAAPSTAAV